MRTEIPIRLSNRHIHLTEQSVKELFGEQGLTLMRYLNGDSGPFACNETVTLKGPKGSIANVRVLGPLRGYDQAELLAADCYVLGVDAPVHMTGDLEGAAALTVVGPCGQVDKPCGIIAQRHVHVRPDIALKLGLNAEGIVRVKVGGIRGLIFENVTLNISDKSNGIFMHVDTEEGNAAGLKNNDIGVLYFNE